MNNLKIFDNKDFGQVRTIEINNQPWFIAKDICEILELTNTTVAIQNLDADEVTKFNLGGLIGETNLINESGLYALVIRSRKPTAKNFRKWVTSEVLPSIRKTGMYATDELLDNPDLLIAAATRLKEERAARLQAEQSVQALKPKADYFDELVDRNLLTSFRDTAKQLEIKEKDFISFLMNNKYIYRSKKGKLMPYADKNNGLFEVKECFNGKSDWAGLQTLVTPKGRETFRLLTKAIK